MKVPTLSALLSERERKMIRFECDYAEGMHPRILERLVETNMEQTAGYGEDSHCERAAALIKQACGREDIDVHFLVGGTQTNLTVIGSILRPYQGVFCADTGHLNVHETGAIEATGHKVIVLPTTADGRLTAAEIRKAYEAHWNDATHEHMVQPGDHVIFLSPQRMAPPTPKAELEEISAICRKCELPLFIDGADWVMRWQRRIATIPCRILQGLRMCSILAAQRSVQ